MSLRADGTKKKRMSIAASITLEASLLLPLFLIFFTVVLSLFEMLRLQNAVEIAMHQKGNEIALVRYEAGMLADVGSGLLDKFDQKKERGKVLDKVPDGVMDVGSGLINAGAAQILVSKYLEPTGILDSPVLASDILVLPTSINDDRGIISIEATFETKPYLDFSWIGLPNTRMEARYFGHDWTGFNYEKEEEKEEEEEDDPDVYLANNDSRHCYHKDRNCTYLTRETAMTASVEDMDTKRRKGGGRYRPCSRCAKESGPVYYTKYGVVYHSDPHCTELFRTIITEKESTAIKNKNRACKKCG